MKKSEIGRKIAARQKEKRVAKAFFGEEIDLSRGYQEHEEVDHRIGEFSGIEELPGCDPISDLYDDVNKKYGGDANKIFHAAGIIASKIPGLDGQIALWEELKRAVEIDSWMIGQRKYAGVKGSREILTELKDHLNTNGGNDITEDNLMLLNGGSTAALHFLTDIFGKVAYGYPGYLYDIHAGFKSDLIPFEAWSLDELLAQVHDNRERMNIEAVIINIPHNPIGYNIEEDNVEKLERISKNTRIILDNVYGQFDEKASAMLKGVKNKIILRSFSKEFAMPGLRFGYAVFDNPEEREMMETYSSAVSVSMANPLILLAKWAVQFNRQYGLTRHIVSQMRKRQGEFKRGIEGIEEYGIHTGDVEGMYRPLYLDNCRLSKSYNSRTFAELCKIHGVNVTPLEIFAPPFAAEKGLKRTGIRIAVSGDPRAYEGGQRVLEAAEEMYERR